MNVTIECISDKQPHGAHEFELEIPEEHLTIFEGRGQPLLSGVVCPTCEEEQELDGKEIVKVLRGKGSKVERGKSKKPSKKTKDRELKGKDLPDPATEYGRDGQGGGE